MSIINDWLFMRETVRDIKSRLAEVECNQIAQNKQFERMQRDGSYKRMEID